MGEITRLAKSIITEELEKAGYSVRRVLLFGSRARGDFRPDSDWDFYVVVDRDISFPETQRVATRIRRRFVEAGFWGDVIIQSEKLAEKHKRNTGYLAYYVFKEGVEV